MIVSHTQQQHANSLAAYMPSGKMFLAAKKSTTNFRKFIEGLAEELQFAEGYLKTYQDEYDVRTTSLLIDAWESALGIPDSCFTGAGTLEERRRDALAKLGSLGVQTTDDLVFLATIFEVDVEITTGTAGGFFFPASFPAAFFDSPKSGKFSVVVKFLTSSPLVPLVECLFSKLIPANCILIIIE